MTQVRGGGVSPAFFFKNFLEVEFAFTVRLAMDNDYVLYLRVGDRVYHKKNLRWGVGVVIEERRSELPGGFCYVRIDFQDGKVRIFDNNFKSENCCYYAGIEKIEIDEDSIRIKSRETTKRKRKSLPKLKK